MNKNVQIARDSLNLLTIKDVVEISGWSEETVRKMFRQDTFPAITYGKCNMVVADALKEYLSRCK